MDLGPCDVSASKLVTFSRLSPEIGAHLSIKTKTRLFKFSLDTALPDFLCCKEGFGRREVLQTQSSQRRLFFREINRRNENGIEEE